MNTVTIDTTGIKIITVGVQGPPGPVGGNWPGVVNVQTFGAVGNGSTDDWSAFDTAIASLGLDNNPTGGIVFVPKGVYRFSKPLHLRRSVILQGVTGNYNNPNCTLKFDAGIHGLIIDSGYELSINHGRGGFSSVRDLVITATAKTYRVINDAVTTDTSTTLTSATANFSSGDIGKALLCGSESLAVQAGAYIASVESSTSCTMSHFSRQTGTNQYVMIGGGCGVVMNELAELRNLVVFNFAGHGVTINTDIPYSNANGWVINFVWSRDNDGHGFHIRGGDSNAGIASGCGSFTNKGWGFYESSSAANTYVGCETGYNVTGGYTSRKAIGGGTFVGCYSEGEESYFTGNAIILGGNLSTSETLPGSAGGFFKYSGDGSAIVLSPVKVVSYGRVNFTDGVVVASSTTFVSASGAFTNTDIGKDIRVMSAGSLGFAGETAVLHATIVSVTNGTTVVLTSAAGVSATGLTWDIPRTPSTTVQLGDSRGNNNNFKTLNFSSDDGGAYYDLIYDGGPYHDSQYGGFWSLVWNASVAVFKISNGLGSGNVIPAGSIVFTNGYWTGDVTAPNIVTKGTAPPISGTWRRGDRIDNVTPSASGYAGWLCVTAGTPGTWKGFGVLQA